MCSGGHASYGFWVYGCSDARRPTPEHEVYARIFAALSAMDVPCVHGGSSTGSWLGYTAW